MPHIRNFSRFWLSLLLFVLFSGWALHAHAEPAAPSVVDAPNDRSAIGANLPKLTNSEMLWTLNQAPLAGDWLTQCDASCNYTWNTNEQDQLVFDADGWVVSFGNNPNRRFTHVALAYFAGAPQAIPAGEWIVLYEGEATVEYSDRPFVTVVSRSPGRDVLRIEPTPGYLLRIRLSNINPNNHLRNLRLIPPGGICGDDPFSYADDAGGCPAGNFRPFEDVYDTQRFHPLMLQALRPYRSLRFMQWIGIVDDITPKRWEDRSRLGDALWHTGWGDSPPLELIFELSNQLQADPWINIPFWADDAYVRSFAQLARDQLDPALVLYLEYSNEVWNFAYPYSIYGSQIEAWAEERWPDAVDEQGNPISGYTKRMNWVGMRSAQICAIWKDAWGADGDRVRCVMPGGPWEFPAAEALACPLYAAENGGQNCAGQMYAVASAPYFGGYVNDNRNADGGHHEQLLAWTQQADGGLNSLFHELRTGELLTAQWSDNGAIPAAVDVMRQNKTVADAYGLQLVAYEGGQHLTPVSGLGTSCNEWNNNPDCPPFRAVQNLFIAANRDPRMGELYTEYLNEWRRIGGGLFVHFTAVSLPNGQYGSFGAKESILQPDAQAHKQQAIFKFIEDNPCWWPGCEHTNAPIATPTATPVPVETPTVAPGDPSWQVTTLDVRGYVGQHADIALDASGHPHLAYNSDEGGVGQLRYAWWDGFVWHIEVVDEAVSTGEYPSIGIGVNGQPRIAYYHRAETALKHAQRNADGTWQTEIIDGNQDRGRFASMAIEPVSGVADIVYYERQDTRLLHVRGPAGTWTFREVDDSGDVGEDASLARGPNGLLAASYYDRTNGALKYAQWNQATLSWTPVTVDDVGDVGRFTDIAFDSLGRPHISYLEADEFNTYILKYAVRNGAQWTTRTVETNVHLAPTSLVIGPQDLPVIAYRKQGIRLARLKENVWNVETVDSTAGAGNSLAMARNAAEDREHLVYEDSRYRDLGYAVWSPAWQAQIVGGGDRPWLAVRSGRPHILYRGSNAGQTLQRVTGQPGPTWGRSSLRNGAGESSNPLLLDANGVEHAAFYEEARRAIVYATFVNGAWQYEDAAILPEDAFAQPTLRLVLRNGQPHVIYTYYSEGVSMHIAHRVNGVWQRSTHPSPQSLGGEPNFDALVLDNGNLAISYWDAGNSDLRLILWNGVNWLDTLVDAGSNGAEVGEYNAIARGIEVVEGTAAETLAIAYFDRTNRALRYAYTVGLTWQNRELVPNVGNVTGLDLALAGDTYALPFIVFSTQDGNVRLAFSNNNLQTVTLETVAEDAADFTPQPSLAYDNLPRIAYRNATGQIVYTFPTARRAIPAPVHNDAGVGIGVIYGAGLDLPVCLYLLVLPQSSRTATLAAALLPDGQVMAQMTDRFRASSGGQRYLGLAAQHGQEMAVIARGDPALLWDGHRVMQNFMPGLEAWVSGRGDEVIVTQQMVDDALDIWQRIAAQASPDLAAAINAELAATNNLQNFVGDSFAQWAEEIGVGSGEIELYLPMVTRRLGD